METTDGFYSGGENDQIHFCQPKQILILGISLHKLSSVRIERTSYQRNLNLANDEIALYKYQ